LSNKQKVAELAEMRVTTDEVLGDGRVGGFAEGGQSVDEPGAVRGLDTPRT
jgi:hypothetical protein